jgi:hypothetical protein
VEHRKIYCAGLYTGLSKDTINSVDYPYRLESYHYIKDNVMERVQAEGRKIFLDSGAFSAFTKGAVIDIDAYSKFIKKWDAQIEWASVLDGIGDPVKTLENQHILEDLGVNVLPCFHYGEPFHYLERYLRDYSHITLGGMVPITTPQLIMWLDQVWGGPLKEWCGKVHGFGLTTISTILQYPWYSVDSTVWVKAGRFGAIIVPKFQGLGLRINISSQSGDKKSIDRHFTTLAQIEQDKIRGIIEDHGFTVDALADDYRERDRWNIQAMYALMEMPYTPRMIQPGLFD